MYAIESPSQQSCEIGEVFGTQPENSCLLGHCYLFLHQVSLQHVQGSFRLLLRNVPTTWKVFVGEWNVELRKGTRKRTPLCIYTRSFEASPPFSFYGKTNPQATLSFSAWLLILCMFIFNLSFVSLRCNPHRSSSLVCSLVVFSLHVFYATFYNAALLRVPTG